MGPPFTVAKLVNATRSATVYGKSKLVNGVHQPTYTTGGGHLVLMGCDGYYGEWDMMDIMLLHKI